MTYLEPTQQTPQTLRCRLHLGLVQQDLGVGPAHGDPSIPVRGRSIKLQVLRLRNIPDTLS